MLRHELSILPRQVSRPRFAARDRLVLAALSRVLPRHSWRAFSVKPETLLRWHRRLVANHWTYPHRRPARPPIDHEVRELILRVARENKSWGYLRIVGELRKLGIDVSATLVRNILRRPEFRRHPSATGRTGARSCASTPRRRSPVTSSPSTPSCCDVHTCSWTSICIVSRRIKYTATTTNPDGRWMVQQARNLLMDLDDRGRRPRSPTTGPARRPHPRIRSHGSSGPSRCTPRASVLASWALGLRGGDRVIVPASDHENSPSEGW